MQYMHNCIMYSCVNSLSLPADLLDSDSGGVVIFANDLLRVELSWRCRICSGSPPVISTIFRRRPGPPNVEGARRYAGSVCISLTRKRTMFVYYSSLLLIFRLPKTS